MSGIESSSLSLKGAYVGLVPLAVFRFHGPDRHEVLNGLLTNEIKTLAKGRGVHACLLSPQGKLMAHLFVQNRGEDLLGLCPREIFPTLQLTLNKYLSVSETVVEDLSDWSCLGLFPSELSASSENDLISAFFVGDLLLGRPFWAIPGKGESITDRLGSFSRQGAQYLKSKDLDVWRVEAGLPLLGLDVDETVFPIEANLQRAVHPHKGCYLGQEVIARLTNKGQARRRLIRLKLPFDVGLRGFVYFNDQEVGHVTSVVYSYRYNTWIGLALLLNMATNPGAHVEIKEMNKLINAEVF